MRRHLKILTCLLLSGLYLDWFAATAATTTGVPGTVPASIEKSASPAIRTRFALHPDFDRLVVKLPSGATALARQDGAKLTLKFSGAGQVTGNAVVGRRMLSMMRGQSDATIQLAMNVRVRSWRAGDLFVIDVFDSGKPDADPSSSIPSGATVAARQPASQHNVSPARARAEDSPPFRSPVPATLPTEVRLFPRGAAELAPRAKTEVPAALPHTPTLSSRLGGSVEPGSDASSGASHSVSVMLLRDAAFAGPALLVPFGRDVGAAAFSRGGEGRVVFDAAQSFDLSGLKDDSVFGGVTEQLLPDGVQLRLRLGTAYGMFLTRREDGWVISLQAQPEAPLSPIAGQNRRGMVAFDARAAGHIVIVNDELTGGRLLVGTQRVGGQHVASSHLSAEAVILPTWQGVAVQPVSDRLLFRATQTGFELSSMNAPPLAMIWSAQQTGAWPDGRTMTRLFDFSNAPPEALHRMLGQALRDAAATPKLSRFGPRIGVAKAMLAQGMDVEASAVLRTAEADDPAGHDGRCAPCLGALASWMSAKAGGTDVPKKSVDPASFGDSDEATLLKALLLPTDADTAGQAAAVATTWPLLLSYPPNLRRFMLEPVADLLLSGGQHKALSAFLAAFPDSSLDLARANLARAQGKIDECLRLYDQVAGHSDRLARANALEQLVLVKLALKRMSPQAAAEALNRQLYAWRADDRELRLRQQVAKLRGQAGQWRQALAMINETEQTFPQSHADLQAAKSALVAELLTGDNLAKLNAMDLVAIADSTSDVLDSNDVSFAPALIDKLVALDLSARAEPIMRRLFERAKDPRTKAELGVRLAESMLGGSDSAAAQAVLDASDDADLGAAIVSRRALLRARAFASSGKTENALQALRGLHGQDASELEATIRESQHDWSSAVRVLKPLIFDISYAAMSQIAQRDLVLRLARDEAEAGDQEGLHTLRQTQSAQFQNGPNAALFAVLTAEPVRSTADLPRSSLEIKSLQSVPASIAHSQSF